MAVKNKGISYTIGAFFGTIIGFAVTATITTYVGLFVLSWLGLN